MAPTQTREYWQAEELVKRVLKQFNTANEKTDMSGQRSAFYQLAKYQAKTLHILKTAVGKRNHALTQASLQNILQLHGTMLDMHHQASDIIPLPLLIDEDDREEFASDLVMRVISESASPLDIVAITERATHLDMLGDLKKEEITDNVERLLAGEQIIEEEGGYAVTTRPYNELDLDSRSLFALLGHESYQRFKRGGFSRVGDIRGRFASFKRRFSVIAEMSNEELPDLFYEVAVMLLKNSLAEVSPFHHQDILSSTIPRPYQREAFEEFQKKNFNCSIIEAPTGSGKTLIGMMCIQSWLQTLHAGQSIMVLVPTNAYQQQWLAELCYNPIGLQLSPEMVFTGTISHMAEDFFKSGELPPVILLTYTGLSQICSEIGKGGFNADGLEMVLQGANIQHVILDEVHKVVSNMHSTSTEITRILVEWRKDRSLRGLVGFSGTAESYRKNFSRLGMGLVHKIEMDELVAAGFVAPFGELGVPFSYSKREKNIRQLLDSYKSLFQDYCELLGHQNLRNWFAEIEMDERLLVAHDLLGMNAGKKDWIEPLTRRLAQWEQGEEIKLTEMNLLLVVQICLGLSDVEMVERSNADTERFDELRREFEEIRTKLTNLIYLPQTIERLKVDGFCEIMDKPGLEEIVVNVAKGRRNEAVRNLLATTITGLYLSLKSWYMRIGEGRVDTIKAVIEAERKVRDISGTIIFDNGRRIRWKDESVVPGYEGVAGLFGQMLGDSGFTVLAAISSEIYLSHDESVFLPGLIADFIDEKLIMGECAEAIASLAGQGLDLPDATGVKLKEMYIERLEIFLPTLRDIHAPRPGAFDQKVIKPLRRKIKKLDIGVAGERLLARLHKSNIHMAGLILTLFDYALLARYFRNPKIAELEQVSGKKQKFYVIPISDNNNRKQLMYELTSRIIDEPTLPVNMIIVSSWARTGWNVIRPNLLIDATASRDVTAWQQLRGRAIRAWKSWTNDCYRLSQILQNEEGVISDGDEAVIELLREITSDYTCRKIIREGAGSISTAHRRKLVLELVQKRNKLTHVYEMIKAYGATSQVSYERESGKWKRKDKIAVKHRREIAVNPFNGNKCYGVEHAPLVYENDPRTDLPRTLQQKLAEELNGADERIVSGWLGFNAK